MFCPSCWKDQLVTGRYDMTGGHICEEEVLCSACGAEAGYWAYGYWQPH